MFVGHPILEEIKQGFKLRPTVTIDKSKPMFRAEGEKEVAIRYEKRDPPPMPVFAPPPPPPLSAPLPKPVVNLQSSKRAALLNKLSATSGIRVDRDMLLKSIQSGVQLRKTTVNDRSGLFVDEDLLSDLRGSSRPTTPNSISSMDSSCQGALGASTSGYDSDNSIAPPTARFGPKPPAPVFAPPPPPPPAAPPPKPVVNLQSSKRAALLNKLSNVRAVPFDRDALLKSIQSGVQLRKAAGVQDKSGLIVDEEMMSDLRRSNIPSTATTSTSTAESTPAETMPTPKCTINVNAPAPPPPPPSSMPPPLPSSAAPPLPPTANDTTTAPVKKRRVVKKASVDGTTGKKTKKSGAKKVAAMPPPAPLLPSPSPPPPPTATMSALSISPPQSSASSAAASPSSSSTRSVSVSSQASPQSAVSSTKSGRLSSASSGIGTTSEASSVSAATETRKKWPTVEPVLPAQYAERPKKASDIIFEERNLRVTKEDIDSEIPAGSAAARIAALRKMEATAPVIKAPLPSGVGGRLAATKETQPASATQAASQSNSEKGQQQTATKSSQKTGATITTTKPSEKTTTATSNGLSKPTLGKSSLNTTTSGSKTGSRTGLKADEPPPLPTSAPPPLRHSTKITLGADNSGSSRIVQKSVESFCDDAKKKSGGGDTLDMTNGNGATSNTVAESKVERLRKSFNDKSTTRL